MIQTLEKKIERKKFEGTYVVHVRSLHTELKTSVNDTMDTNIKNISRIEQNRE